VTGTVLEFGDFRLDCDRFDLSRAGRVLKLERKPMELLILLATREGETVTRVEIAERLWGSEVFVDTEHGINTAIRKVRQALRDDPDQPRFVHTVTGRGYRFVGPVIAIPPALASADGQTDLLSPQPPVSSPEASAASSRQRHWIIFASAAALLLVAIVIALRIREHPTHAATPGIQSVAVLPLDNLSGDPAQDYFAAGITDELTTMLAKNSTLRVVSRTSAMQYKGAHLPLRDVASSLGVDGIVEGSIARADGKVHMTLQLIHAPTDTHIWADSYDRDNNEISLLPSEAAQAIAKRLNATVATTKPARHINPEAHDAYLRGMYLLYTNGDASGPYFKRATELQPDYALGWAGLALYYGSGAGATLDPKKVLAPMEAAAQRAVNLDDSLPEAHLALGWALFYAQWDWAAGDRELQRAIELNPQYSEAIHRRAEFLAVLNRPEEAIAAQKTAMEIDPFSRPRAMALLYLWARQYDAAITDLQQRLQTRPDDVGLLYTLHVAYRCKGMKKEAVRTLERYLQVTGGNAAWYAWKNSPDDVRRAWDRGGYNAVLQMQISTLERLASKQYVSPVDLALLYAQLGEREKTLSLLEAGMRERNPNLLWIQCDPAYDFLPNDRRYRDLIQKIGLPPAW
jgi:TolB-like protein/DNA-binding winged helix-turn-helix (wHTH) protein